MTNNQILRRLVQYYDVQREVAVCMMAAMDFFEMGEETESWFWLFEWGEACDARGKIWKRFQDHYCVALVLKEGMQP